jgi:hypothetical protein
MVPGGRGEFRWNRSALVHQATIFQNTGASVSGGPLERRSTSATARTSASA